jgi:hypothetical protein
MAVVTVAAVIVAVAAVIVAVAAVVAPITAVVATAAVVAHSADWASWAKSGGRARKGDVLIRRRAVMSTFFIVRRYKSPCSSTTYLGGSSTPHGHDVYYRRCACGRSARRLTLGPGLRWARNTLGFPPGRVAPARCFAYSVLRAKDAVPEASLL